MQSLYRDPFLAPNLQPSALNSHVSTYKPYRTNFRRLSLAASAPNVLQQTITLAQSVQGIVALAHGPYETAQGVDLVLAGVSAVLVDLADGNLDRGVVLGLDDAVGGAALAWDVAV
jgi:hypothetical protein